MPLDQHSVNTCVLRRLDFSVQPLRSLCLGGDFRPAQPQRHREHRGCTEKQFKLGHHRFTDDDAGLRRSRSGLKDRDDCNGLIAGARV